MQRVGIIGGSGFIGSYVTQVFLNNGFEVKVSATDISKEEKYKHLMELPHADQLHISELNVENKAALKSFMHDCDIVIHGGTPFILDVHDPQTQLFDPTVKGTENFLEVVSESADIQKVVFIASVASYNTNFPMPPDGKTPLDTIDENDQKFIGHESHPYGQAKFLANKAVEQFIEQNPKLPFEISSVSPVMVCGKALSNREDSTSGGMQFLFKNKIAPNPFVQMMYDTDVAFAIVDVADVADAIYKVATTKGLHGKNYLLSSETYPVSDMNLMLNQLEPKNKGAIVYKNALAKADLGISFRPARKTLNDYSLNIL
jgi:nucleoside-diphosphate-sugar epimerase